MPVEFRRVTLPPLRDFFAAAYSGAVTGLIGLEGAGKRKLLRLAAGLDEPLSGEVYSSGERRYLGSADPLNLEPTGVLAIDQTFARLDAVAKAKAALAVDRARRSGTTILLASHDEDLLARLCDEIWWLDQGKLAEAGDPGEVLTAYRRYAARKIRESGEQAGAAALNPSFRAGDGRAHILSIQMLGEGGQPTMILRSGEQVSALLEVKFDGAVACPVVGIMIRTRTGFEVYGTNTELERLDLGPCEPGDILKVIFTFSCDLCPQEYTLTAASHDPDGLWHDWVEDAIAFSVSGDRHTAGVARLNARAAVERLRPSVRG